MRVALFGNSHMQMWIHGLQREAKRLGIRLEPYIKYGCSPFRFQMLRRGEAWPECRSWREWAIGQIKADPPDLVVVASHTDLQLKDAAGNPTKSGRAWNRQWRRGVNRTATTLGRKVDRVVVLGDSTTRDKSPGTCVKERNATMASCEQALTSRTQQLLRITEGPATAAGASYLDMNSFLCLDNRCPVVSARYFTLRDAKGHISAAYSLRAGQAFARSLGLRAG